jgi:hypothetical protein
LYIFCRLRSPKPRVAGSIPAGRTKTGGFLTYIMRKFVKKAIICT